MEIISNIITLFEKELRVSHRIIARETDNNEISVRKLIDKHKESLELFGLLSFEMTTVKNSVGAINEEKTYYLNEPQATLLLTFMRNNEIVKSFKIRLVKEFYRMREEIKSQQQKSEILTPNQNTNFVEYLQNLKEYKAYTNEMLDFLESLQKRDRISLYRFDKFMSAQFNESPLKKFKIDLKNEYFIPTELGEMKNRSPVEINKILESKGFQIKENSSWRLTEKGREFGIEIANGSFLQIKWRIESILN